MSCTDKLNFILKVMYFLLGAEFIWKNLQSFSLQEEGDATPALL